MKQLKFVIWAGNAGVAVVVDRKVCFAIIARSTN